MRAKRQNKKPKLEREVRPGFSLVEQMTGIEPASSAWEADILPLNYICKAYIFYHNL